MSEPTMRELERAARERVEAVSDDPEARLALREQFYDRHGFGPRDGSNYGYGDSEIAFMRWEVDRGVLEPTRGSRPGSRWWRGVNAEILFQAELASLAAESALPPELSRGLPAGARQWLAYLVSPSARSWYRAHNTSVLLGYRAQRGAAREEQQRERVFMNLVLARLLFAQAMVEGASLAMGPLAEILANPRLPAVATLVELPDFYPRDYPMSHAEFEHLLGRGLSLEEAAVRILDGDLVVPHLTELYGLASRWNGTPFVERFLRRGAPIYPELADRHRVAVLGGGVGAITAAFALTDPENPRSELYDLTVYQMGWRLGGKGASGRNMAPLQHHRIQEHGLHIWFGFYDNAFRAMRKCYRELGEIRPETGEPLRAPDAPLSTWEAAFVPHESGGMFQDFQGRWSAWNKWMPSNDFEPGESGLLPVWDYLVMALSVVFDMLRAPTLPSEPHSANIFLRFPVGMPRRLARLASRLENAGLELLERILADAGWLARLVDAEGRLLVWLLEQGMTRKWQQVKGRIDYDIEVQRDWEWLNFLYGHLRGVFSDRLIERGFDSINHLDYREWLQRHLYPDGGRTARSALMYGSYDACFAYRDGDNTIPPGCDFPPKADMEAGTTVRAALRLFLTYKGAGIWKMQAGMGDTVFGPFYQVLKARGVRFEFFHRVREIVPSEDGGTVDELVIERQADVDPEQDARGGYDPLVEVKGLPCWPDRPLYSQLVQGPELERQGIDLEAYDSPWPGVGTLRLRRGEHFDSVVCGISIGALPYVAPRLVRVSRRWKAAVDHVKTIPTMGIQLWLEPTAWELGWRAMNTPIFSGLDYPGATNPPDTFADMSHLIARESWPSEPYPLNTTYFTGSLAEVPLVPSPDGPVAPPGGLDQDRADARVLERTHELLASHVRFIYPSAYHKSPDTGVEGFDWSLLHDERSGARGERRLAAQWFVGNVQPSERYVLTVRGSSQYRLPPHDPSEFTNLFLAGDWIDCHLNYGCVEAAAMGGLLCANALCGYPSKRKISGLDW